MPSSYGIDISNSFRNDNLSLFDYFATPGLGLSIPIYQRPYSWGEDNIKELLAGIYNGVGHLTETNTPDKVLNFLGTLITLKERQPSDGRSLPTGVDKIIDGQQRLSTAVMISTILLEKIQQHYLVVANHTQFSALRDVTQDLWSSLIKVFSFEVLRGGRKLLPGIIREGIDSWSLNSNDTYQTELAKYLSQCIEAIKSIDDNCDFNSTVQLDFSRILANATIAESLTVIRENLDDFSKLKEDFPPAWEIVAKINDADLWLYPQPELKAYILSLSERSTLTNEDKHGCILIQLLAVANYFLKRCCFTVIRPIDENWAFDMFQTLNATGVPLTAIETFKPLVLNQITVYPNSIEEHAFSRVSAYLDSKNPTAKGKATDSTLLAFALAVDGTKLENRFSRQRAFLIDKYSNLSEPKRPPFVGLLGLVASHLHVLEQFTANKQSRVDGASVLTDDEASLCSFLLAYLDSANHRMAHYVLSRYHSYAHDSASMARYLDLLKSLGSFFTLWRVAKPRQAPDGIYRDLMREIVCWERAESLAEISHIKDFLKSKLQEKGIGGLKPWLAQATSGLRYGTTPNAVIRFVLLLANHNTTSDPENLGAMIEGVQGLHRPLSAELWRSINISTIEHIAPQTVPVTNGWDDRIYNDGGQNKIGNLTLLPISINSSIGNRPWPEKRFYYEFLGTTQKAIRDQLEAAARSTGISVSDIVLNELSDSQYAYYIASIVSLPANQPWTKDIVDLRSQRICEILWNRMWQWLN